MLHDLMLAKKAPKTLDEYAALGERYIMEPKVDGMRVGATVVDGKVTFFSRTHKTQDGKLPHLEQAFASLGRNFTIDGEVVALASLVETNQGLAPLGDFNKTMRVMGSDAAKAVAKQNASEPLVFLAFDILELDGEDIQPFSEGLRRTLLGDIVSQLGSFVSVLPRFECDMQTYIDYTVAGGEGMMVKDTMAGYVGKRRGHWLKVKVEMTEDVIVTGYKPGKGRFADTIGAVVFSQYDSFGNLVERGACSGMNDALRYEIGNDRDGFLGKVMEVKHFGYASEAEVEGLRHPVFVAFRTDKNAEDCTIV